MGNDNLSDNSNKIQNSDTQANENATPYFKNPQFTVGKSGRPTSEKMKMLLQEPDDFKLEVYDLKRKQSVDTDGGGDLLNEVN